ncbi:MAG TPA: MarR family transcriptional regulator [Geopsychrobacteraceae bacterium]|nr:MarR family transcriptional regulator [Geopsychrobacteraceae bacterium]
MKNPTDKFASHQKLHVPQGSYDLRILQALRRIIRAVDIHSHRLSSLHNITAPQLACLMAIKEEAPISCGNLAKKVYLSPSTVVGIVDRLEEKKLVSRYRGNKDRRLVHLLITPTGEKLVEEAPSLLQETLANALVELPKIEQVSITLALEKLVDLMEARHIGAAPLLETGSLSKGK